MASPHRGRRVTKVARTHLTEKPIVKVDESKKEEEQKAAELQKILKAGESLTCPWENYTTIRYFIDDCMRNQYETTKPINMRDFKAEISHVPYETRLTLLECIMKKILFFDPSDLEFSDTIDPETIKQVYYEQAEFLMNDLEPDHQYLWFTQFVEDFLMVCNVKTLQEVLVDLFMFLYDEVNSPIQLEMLFSNITSLDADYCPEIVKINTEISV